jgi:hypothetical protein
LPVFDTTLSSLAAPALLVSAVEQAAETSNAAASKAVAMMCLMIGVPSLVVVPLSAVDVVELVAKRPMQPPSVGQRNPPSGLTGAAQTGE